MINKLDISLIHLINKKEGTNIWRNDKKLPMRKKKAFKSWD